MQLNQSNFDKIFSKCTIKYQNEFVIEKTHVFPVASELFKKSRIRIDKASRRQEWPSGDPMTRKDLG